MSPSSTEAVAAGFDPITFEVVRNKLQAITDEQAITLKAMSGSPVVVNASDFNNGIYGPDGSIVTMGKEVMFHAGTMSTVIRSIIEHFEERPGIRAGDMFILNDPYRGAVHQPDASIVAPIFHEGRRIAWAGACAHLLDVGGMSFGSWSVNATEIQQEAMLLPGIKLVEAGELRDDLWQMIMGMSRLPGLLGLDLKAMMAANRVAERRLLEIVERYGIDTVEAIMQAEVDNSERRLRERLRRLPDGVFRARDYIEHDGHADKLYEVRLAVHKQGDSLTFDMNGTSHQAPGFINCTRSGMVGALLTGLMPILASDISWNEGLLRPLTFIAPDGIVCNASWPAPVSSGTVSGAWIVQNVAVAALSRMVGCSEATRGYGQGVTKGSMTVLTMGGRDRDGGPFATFLLDSMAGGGGAFCDHDGLDPASDYCVPRPEIPNVENAEASGPFLYLYRGVIPDSGGPGRQRGGVGTGLAVTPHDAERLNAMLIGHGAEVPNSVGLFGGLEGGCNENLLWRADGASGPAPIEWGHTPAALKRAGAESLGPKPGHFQLEAGDALAYSFQGGGGYGDPITRDPDLVLRDWADGYVTEAGALASYGVALRDGAVDEGATAAARRVIRAQRLGHDPDVDDPPPLRIEPDEVPMGSTLKRDAGGSVRCACGEDLGPSDRNWKEQAAMRVIDPESHGPLIRLHADLELREYACPRCGTLLASELATHDEAALFEIELAR